MKDDLLHQNAERTAEQLYRLQKLPLEQKVNLSLRRIQQFHTYMKHLTYVSFSGGKDSTVLLHLVRSLFPDTPAVFCDTGLEYPEIKDFVKTVENVEIIRPKTPFKKVLEKYGYPVISKKVSMGINRYNHTKSDLQKELRMNGGINPTSGKKQAASIPKKYHYLTEAPFEISEMCCDHLKKYPFKKYHRETNLNPFIGTMAAESRIRQQYWIKDGCNAFNKKYPSSTPLSFWSEEDVWNYLKSRNLPYSKIYDMGEQRTGCMFCLYGCQFKDDGGRARFDRMETSHPKQYALCKKLGILDVLKYIESRDEPTLF